MDDDDDDVDSGKVSGCLNGTRSVEGPSCKWPFCLSPSGCHSQSSLRFATKFPRDHDDDDYHDDDNDVDGNDDGDDGDDDDDDNEHYHRPCHEQCLQYMPAIPTIMWYKFWVKMMTMKITYDEL